MQRLAADRPLVSSGLVSVDQDGDLSLVKRLLRLASPLAEDDGDVRSLLLDPAPPAELEWADFDHIAAGRDHIERLMRGALEQRATGVKRAAARGRRAPARPSSARRWPGGSASRSIALAKTDEDGGRNPRVGKRLQELRLAQRLVSGDESAVLLFDEMEGPARKPRKSTSPRQG